MLRNIKALVLLLLLTLPANAQFFQPTGSSGGGGGSGTVTSVSVVSANGLAGTVATATTTPAITLTTTINSPVLAGNGTGLIAATTTGSGSTAVLNNGPTLIAPALGTPASGVLTNATGLPISTGVSGLGTNVATALGVNVGSAGAFITFNGNAGTPSALVGTNITGTASGLTAGNVTTNANLTGPITSSGNATSIAAQTGTGTTFAMQAGPSFTGVTNVPAGSAVAPSLSVGNATTGLYSVGIGLGFSINGVRLGDYGIAVSGQWNLSNGIETSAGGFYSFATRSFMASPADGSFKFANAAGSALLNLSWPATATWQLGLANAASPVAQILQPQGSRVGTDTNTAGGNLTIKPGVGTGNATPSALNFNSWVATTSGSGTQTDTLTLQITNGDIFAPNMPSDSGQTDATVCRDSTSGRLYKGSGTLGICLGTSSARFKQDFAPLSPGLAQIAMLKPLSYRYLPGYGDDGIREQFGFTAEDVAPILPTLVGRDMEGRPNTVDMLGMLPIMVKSIQELNARVRTLEGAR